MLAGLLVVVLLPERLGAPVTAQKGPVIRPDIPVIPPGSAYRQTNLISDLPGLSLLQDPLLVNPWGISATSSSPFWMREDCFMVAGILRLRLSIIVLPNWFRIFGFRLMVASGFGLTVINSPE
jgi:hypothetical protein